MAEDIRDMSIMGKVYEFKNQANADLYMMRDGRTLEDNEEMFSVGGYTRVFSLEHNEPALGMKYISSDEITDETAAVFYLDDSTGKWLKVDGNAPEDAKLAAVMDEEFFEAVESHWLDDEKKYNVEEFKLGRQIVFRNGIDGPMIEGATKGDVMVKRVRRDGITRYYWPNGSKMFSL